MKISRSTQYGLIALGYIAQHGKNGLVMSEAISKQYNIPREYLLKILHQLVRGGVLRSKRGPRGGFSLAQKPEDIKKVKGIGESIFERVQAMITLE